MFRIADGEGVNLNESLTGSGVNFSLTMFRAASCDGVNLNDPLTGGGKNMVNRIPPGINLTESLTAEKYG